MEIPSEGHLVLQFSPRRALSVNGVWLPSQHFSFGIDQADCSESVPSPYSS